MEEKKKKKKKKREKKNKKKGRIGRNFPTFFFFSRKNVIGEFSRLCA